eukprot:PhM_4_TR11618/c1_g1_i14/m.9631
MWSRLCRVLLAHHQHAAVNDLHSLEIRFVQTRIPSSHSTDRGLSANTTTEVHAPQRLELTREVAAGALLQQRPRRERAAVRRRRQRRRRRGLAAVVVAGGVGAVTRTAQVRPHAAQTQSVPHVLTVVRGQRRRRRRRRCLRVAHRRRHETQELQQQALRLGEARAHESTERHVVHRGLRLERGVAALVQRVHVAVPRVRGSGAGAVGRRQRRARQQLVHRRGHVAAHNVHGAQLEQRRHLVRHALRHQHARRQHAAQTHEVVLVVHAVPEHHGAAHALAAEEPHQHVPGAHQHVDVEVAQLLVELLRHVARHRLVLVARTERVPRRHEQRRLEAHDDALVALDDTQAPLHERLVQRVRTVHVLAAARAHAHAGRVLSEHVAVVAADVVLAVVGLQEGEAHCDEGGVEGLHRGAAETCGPRVVGHEVDIGCRCAERCRFAGTRGTTALRPFWGDWKYYVIPCVGRICGVPLPRCGGDDRLKRRVDDDAGVHLLARRKNGLRHKGTELAQVLDHEVERVLHRAHLRDDRGLAPGQRVEVHHGDAGHVRAQCDEWHREVSRAVHRRHEDDENEDDERTDAYDLCLEVIFVQTVIVVFDLRNHLLRVLLDACEDLVVRHDNDDAEVDTRIGVRCARAHQVLTF